jgi:C4-dicarboxylate-specific signal transduction histidine kinase
MPILNKDQLHEFINDLPVMLIWVDQALNITELNRMAHHLLVEDQENLIGQPLLTLFPVLIDHQDSIINVLTHHEKLCLSQQQLDYNSRSHPCYVTVYPLTEQAGLLIKIEDLSHQMLLDDIVIQSEKMITIGGLAAGMAHEIKNPLGIILQNIQNILCRLDKTSEKNQALALELNISLEGIHQYLEQRQILKFMDNIRIAIDRALQVIATMLNFGTQNPISMKEENIITLIENALSFAEQDYDLLHTSDIAKIKIHKDFQRENLSLVCSSTQITQVLFNLIKNGMQALHGLPNPELTIKAYEENNHIIVKVSDNGLGIPEHLLANLFKPFFTTKSKEQGTGLGLAVSHYIVNENHHGSLSAGNPSTGGACFTMKLSKNISHTV